MDINEIKAIFKQKINKDKENEERKEKMKEIYKLSLIERKRKVLKELEKEFLDTEKIKDLLLMDNTNENLIFKYFLSLDKNIIIHNIEKYSSYMSVSKIKELQTIKFGNKNQGYRNTSYKAFFFKLIDAMKSGDKAGLKKVKSIITLTHKTIELNNQPFDLSNFEAFYFYLCGSLVEQINQNNENEDEYLLCMKTYLNSMSKILNNYRKENYEVENKNIKKFLIIFLSIINLDEANSSSIAKIAVILTKPDDEFIQQMISVTMKKIEIEFDQRVVNEFKKLIEDTSIFCCFEYRYIKNSIQIPEQCYLYDYIIENNIFKKYETNLIKFLNIILKSDLLRSIVKIIYKSKDEKMKYFFDEISIEDFWNNNILFIPFKLKITSGFSYKDTFFVLFCFYKIEHFDSEIENKIFTLGAFIRVLIHEIFGHLMISYFFYMFHANIDEDIYYDSPRMSDQIRELDKKYLCQKVGDFLANIFYDNFLGIINNDLLIKNLQKDFETIIGKDYAEKLTQELLEEYQKKDISKIKKNDFKLELSTKIINILIGFISDEYEKYTNELNLKKEAYKHAESGNFVEFLLFNDFSQYTNLKECLFLLDEENYEKTNLFKFRTKFKNIITKENDEYIEQFNEKQKIFSDLFSQYKSFYRKSKDKNNLTSKKSFREERNDNLNKKFESFDCFNFRLNWRASYD